MVLVTTIFVFSCNSFEFLHFNLDITGSYQTLTKRVETSILDNTVIGSSKGGLNNVSVPSQWTK